MFAIGYRTDKFQSNSFIPQASASKLKKDPYQKATEVQSAFRRVSAQLRDSVVEITVESKKIVDENEVIPWNDFFGDPSGKADGLQYHRSSGLGSGVIVERDAHTYYVITNAHVIAETEEVTVSFLKNETATGYLVGIDSRKDLALIRFDYTHSILPVATFGDSDLLYVGDWVLAFGSPYGYEHSVSSGIVSALERYHGPGGNINDFIQTDASINQGNSGGPLVNIHGEVIGINTFITTPNRGSIGLGFAIPSNNVKNSIRQLIDHAEVRYGWLGVSLGDYDKNTAESLGYPLNHGVMVYQVFENSPAEKAGFLPGDLILSLDGNPYVEHKSLLYSIGDKLPDDRALFSIERFGEKRNIEVLMGERKQEDKILAMHNLAWPGFVAAPITSELYTLIELPSSISGVVVTEVYPHTRAQSRDLRAGDIITKINNKKVSSLSDLYRILGEIEKNELKYSVYRGSEERQLINQGGT